MIMQTFIVNRNFLWSAYCLDNKRLGKQRVECLQIYNALQKRKNNEKGGWVNHPAVLMWENFEEHLKAYQCAIFQVWRDRGFKNNMKLIAPRIKLSTRLICQGTNDTCVDWEWYENNPPWWLKDDRLIDTHKAALYRKDPKRYDLFAEYNTPENQHYYWPITIDVLKER